MNEENLARFLGYLFGDGSLRRKKNKNGIGQTELAIECADLSVVQDFQKLCKEILQRDVGKITSRKRKRSWRTSYSFYCKLNKQWRKLFFKFSPTYRTSPCPDYEDGICAVCKTKHYKGTKYPYIQIPKFIFRNRNNMQNFLQAFTNSEGSVQLRVNRHNKWLEFSCYVKISTEHPTLLKEVSKMLKILEIDNRFAPKLNPNSIIIQKQDSIKVFQKLVGFMDGIKVTPTGIWGNYEKAKILKAVINTFDFERGFLQKFSNDEELYSFIKVNYLPDMASEIRRMDL